MNDARRPQVPYLLLLLTVSLLTSACATETTSTRDAARGPSAVDRSATPEASIPAGGQSPTGTVDRRSGLTNFRPADTSVTVDAETVNLRQVFDDLGEDATLWYQHVMTLANPYFEGRMNGSAGTERARDYMEFYFRLYGLEPAFPASDEEAEALGGGASAMWTSYKQPFDFSARRAVQVTTNGAHASLDGRPLADGDDFIVLGNSGSGDVFAPVTFVGYGIKNGPDGYTSFAGDTDLDGRIALLLRYEPLDEKGASRWTDERFSPNAGLAPKMSAVRDLGAAGIILVNPPGCRDGRKGLEPLERSRRFGRSLEIPVIQMSPKAVQRLLDAADPEGRDLMDLRKLADTSGGTVIDLADTVTVGFGAEVDRSRAGEQITASNVGAVLPGRGALAEDWLVIGAHYDHNGYGMFGTTPDNGPLFPGADDNASGTAGMLLLAKRLSESYAKADGSDLRSVLFIAFDAEERGLHGSRFFSQDPTIEPEHMTCLLNMDMIGRLRSDSLSVLGTGTGEGLEEILRPHFEQSGLRVSMTSAGSGRSDDANFHRMGVPGMHFFTGMHSEYTSPRDKAHTVNPAGAVRVLDLMYDLSMDLVTRPENLTYVRPSRGGGQDRGYAPVRLGIRPGMGSDLETGILVETVSPGASAAVGGIQDGDVLLFWNEIELDGMRTLVGELRKHKPGDVVTIRVRRGGETMDMKVKLQASTGGR